MKGIKVGGVKTRELCIAEGEKVRFNETESRRKRNKSIHKKGGKRKRRRREEKRI